MRGITLLLKLYHHLLYFETMSHSVPGPVAIILDDIVLLGL